MKNTIITIASVAALAGAAHAQVLNFNTLGVDIALASSISGQDINDIGSILGSSFSYLDGVDLNVNFASNGAIVSEYSIDTSGTGVIINGVLTLTFSEDVAFSQRANQFYNIGESNNYLGVGSFTTAPAGAGLTITANSVTNNSSGNITGDNSTVWDSGDAGARVFSFSHSGANFGNLSGAFGTREAIAVPEPSSTALLGLGALGLLARRKR